MNARTYDSLPAFQHVYLEDSWVLDLAFDGESVRIVADLVLLEDHPLHAAPKSGEQYCYLRATLVFGEVTTLSWESSGSPRAVDASGDSDLGTFEVFALLDPDGYHIELDAGVLVLRAASLSVEPSPRNE